MGDIDELKVERQHLILSNQDIIALAEKQGRAVNDEELRAMADNTTRAAELEKQIESLERHMEAKRSAEAALAGTLKPSNRRNIDPVPAGQFSDEGVIEPNYYKVANLKAFKNERAAYKCGQWLRAQFMGDPRAVRWCKDHGVEAQMREKAQTRAQTEGLNSAGGALVPDEFEASVIDLRETYGVFRRNTKVFPMGRDVMIIPRRTGGLTAYFTTEGVAPTESQKSWNQVNLTTKKLSVLTYMSSELNEDAVINLADDLAQEAAYAFALKEDQCGFLGDGSPTYDGIQGIVTKLEAGTTLKSYVDAGSTIDSLGEVGATSLSKLMGRLPQYARMGAKFYCSQAAFSLIFERLAVSAGGNTMQNINGSWTPSYLGYPIEVTQTMFADDGATAGNNKVMLLFGRLDLATTMGDRRGISLRVDESYKFAEDLISLKANQRIDINVHDIGDTTTAGPVVALIGET